MEQQEKVFKERSFNLYGLKSAAQFKIFKSKKDESVLLLEVANALGQANQNAKYDWDNKVSLSLSEADILMLLNGIRVGFNPDKNKNSKGEPKTFSLYHDPGKGGANEGQISKSLSIAPGQSYGFMLSVTQKVKVETEGKKNVSVSMGISDAQLVGLRLILEHSFLVLTGFKDLA